METKDESLLNSVYALDPKKHQWERPEQHDNQQY
ncbi:hypothetical protein [Halothece sp. PCC 7418]